MEVQLVISLPVRFPETEINRDHLLSVSLSLSAFVFVLNLLKDAL